MELLPWVSADEEQSTGMYSPGVESVLVWGREADCGLSSGRKLRSIRDSLFLVRQDDLASDMLGQRQSRGRGVGVVVGKARRGTASEACCSRWGCTMVRPIM